MLLAQVHEWAREAGEIALHYFNDVEARVKADHSVVTAADEEIEALLRERADVRDRLDPPRRREASRPSSSGPRGHRRSPGARRP